jgi:hypothetical protein
MTVEEVDNDTFTKEMKDQEAKMNGKKKGGDVAKPSVQAVKQEEVEQIDELSKGTLGRYIKKAHFAGGMADFRHGMKHDKRGDSKDKMALAKTSHNREKGINKAVDRLTKEEVDMDEDTRLAMQRGPGADMIRYDKDSPAAGAQQHRNDTAKAAKNIRASGKKLGDQDEAKAGDKTVTRYSRTNEGEANEDMLSPGQKKIAQMSPPANKIDANDLAALRAGKKKKSEGNAFSGALANAKASGQDEFEVDGKEYKVQEGESQYMNKDGTFKNPRTDAARERQRAEIEQTQKTSDGNWMGPKDKAPKYRPSEYTQGKYSQEISKAMDQDREERDAARGPLNKIGNYASRLVFGKDTPVDEGRTSMREGWEEMQKYLEKKRGPESKGDAGKKAGTRYGGSAQKDDDEATDGEGQAVVKKKGRPKGTGGGAKFNFKKPKD